MNYHKCALDNCKNEMSEFSPRYCSDHNEMNNPLPTTPSKENWEERFDEKFLDLDNAIEMEWGIKSSEYQDFERIKSFITNLLKEERESLKKEIKGMYKEEKGHWEISEDRLVVLAQANGYNEAISDLLSLISKK